MKKKDIRDSKGEPLNEGDSVKLKTGGNEMIIIWFKEDAWNGYLTGEVLCEWHDELGMKQDGTYPSTGLTKIFS